MEKRTILAVVLSALVIFGFQMLKTYLYPPTEQVANITETAEQTVNKVEDTEKEITENGDFTVDDNLEAEFISFRTDLYDVTFNTKGANVSSLKLLEHNLDVYSDDKVDLVYREFKNESLFNISFGDYKDPIYNDVFEYSRIDDLTHEFTKNFVYTYGGTNYPLTLVKTYTFIPNEYMFELKIKIKNNDNNSIPVNNNGTMYALQIGKQIGPGFKKLDRREEFRKFSVFTEGKRKEQKVKKGEKIFTEQFKWAAIEGKFFALAVIPDNNSSYLRYSDSFYQDRPTSNLSVNRNGNNSSYIEDTYKIYAGPKDKEVLSKYEDLNLGKIISFWPLGMFFMWILQLINKVANNYGFSIIILTLIIKAILYPFTRKSFQSMGKMQTIQPKIQELQAKYKDDPNKLNAAMADLYKREGVNPLGGCLPMLLQMPIFITFYSLLNEFIGLRGAAFIPGWINDLSKPEYILKFGFELPILGWDALRVLPILYVATQLISMKFTQNSQKNAASASKGGPSAMQQKMLTLGMPIMFFFIMYNQTSGLLLYWITMNLVTSIQQIFGKKKSEKELEEERELKLSKKKGKKRK